MRDFYPGFFSLTSQSGLFVSSSILKCLISVAEERGSKMDREKLLKEGVAEKFLRYVSFDTQADEKSQDVPSSAGQITLALRLKDELLAIGLKDAVVREGCIVTATYEGPQRDCPAIGFIAHMDTAPGVPGNSIKPIIHPDYQGGDIILPGGVVLSPAIHVDLGKALGHTIITSDGTTLLGADDKAGIAEIMEALCRLVTSSSANCGLVKVAFTSDEEIGRGIERFDIASFGAEAAYTLDGGIAGELEDENFNASNLRVVITGISAHPGRARGKMINALHLASEMIASVPSVMRPETTDERLGFIHPTSLSGDAERVEMKMIVRDFEEEGLARSLAMVNGVAEDIMRRHQGSRIELSDDGGYKNMKQFLSRTPKVSLLAGEAIRRAGMEPVIRSIRGGTDGAHLSFRGLPTPNLFTGGSDFHSRSEWVSLRWMEKAVEVICNLCVLWAKERSVSLD